MSYSNDVRAASTPIEALTAIAHILDELDSRLKGLETQPSEWDSWIGETPPLIEWIPDVDVEAELVDAKDKLKDNEDPDESKMLRARILLLEDQLRPPVEQLTDTEGNRAAIVHQLDGTVVETPKPTEEMIEARETFARDVLKLEEEYGEVGKEYITSYGKVGPLLLYYTDREFVNKLPDGIKKSMVDDVLKFSPQEGHEMARDILKSAEAGDPEIAVENLIAVMKAGGHHSE